MTNYFISPFEPPQFTGSTNLQIVPSTFEKKLLEQWADTKFTKPTTTQHTLLQWEMSEIGIEGALMGQDQFGQYVYLHGAEEGIAQFARWYRTIVSTEYKLFFFNDSLDVQMELSRHTTEKQIIDALTGGR